MFAALLATAGAIGGRGVGLEWGRAQHAEFAIGLAQEATYDDETVARHLAHGITRERGLPGPMPDDRFDMPRIQDLHGVEAVGRRNRMTPEEREAYEADLRGAAVEQLRADAAEPIGCAGWVDTSAPFDGVDI